MASWLFQDTRYTRHVLNGESAVQKKNSTLSNVKIPMHIVPQPHNFCNPFATQATRHELSSARITILNIAPFASGVFHSADTDLRAA
jgi:hypothetical protein